MGPFHVVTGTLTSKLRKKRDTLNGAADIMHRNRIHSKPFQAHKILHINIFLDTKDDSPVVRIFQMLDYQHYEN